LNAQILSRVEDEWLAARLRGETESTERLLDDAYQGATSDGLPQTKADFVRAIETSGTAATDSNQTERSIRVYGTVAVSSGVATLRSPDRANSFRYLRVFRKSGGEWRLIASQSTRLRVA
jgi:hypothetical protein